MLQTASGGLQSIALIVQIVYWIGMLVLVGYAVAQFKRWVNYQLGVGRSGQLRSAARSQKPSVEEFVD